MPYKIVRTFEKGKNMHWIAPSPWERNNVVKWPKHNALKLVKSANTLPQPDWRDIKCQVKRRNIPTYEEAERQLDFLCTNTDTDEETKVTKNKQASQKEVDLTVFIQQLYADQENSPICGEPLNEPVFTFNDPIKRNLFDSVFRWERNKLCLCVNRYYVHARFFV